MDVAMIGPGRWIRSRQDDAFSGKMPAAPRNESGGHAVKEKE
jgi:6-phosphogluconate dehydrogenase (decarboxylating)